MARGMAREFPLPNCSWLALAYAAISTPIANVGVDASVLVHTPYHPVIRVRVGLDYPSLEVSYPVQLRLVVVATHI